MATLSVRESTTIKCDLLHNYFFYNAQTKERRLKLKYELPIQARTQYVAIY